MTCNQIADLLPDYLQKSLTPEQRAEVEGHMSTCADCREGIALWQKLGTLPDEQPSPKLRERFDAMLDTYQQGRWEKEKLRAARPSMAPAWLTGLAWMRGPLAQAAMAAVLLVAGFLAGQASNKSSASAQELASLHRELTDTRQLVAIKMMQLDSPSERLEGVSWSQRVGGPQPQVLDALLYTLRYDHSVDVRLAALDALRRYHDQPQVRQGVIDALQRPQSPMVQIALVDYLVDYRQKDAKPTLQQLRTSQGLNPVVRQRLEAGIEQLN